MSVEKPLSWQCTTCKVHVRRQSSSTHEADLQTCRPADLQQPTCIRLGGDKRVPSLKKYVKSTEWSHLEKGFHWKGDMGSVVKAYWQTIQTRKTSENIEQNWQSHRHVFREVGWATSQAGCVKQNNRSAAKANTQTRSKAGLQGQITWGAQVNCGQPGAIPQNKNIEIHGIKETARGDLIAVMESVATKINLEPPSRSDLEAIHTLKTGAWKIPPIIVRLKERCESFGYKKML